MSISQFVSITKVLKLGDFGPAVQSLQLALKRMGYGLSGTGYFGPATDTAVTSFQRLVGLTADGQVGLKTAQAIDAHAGLNSNGVQPTPPVKQQIERPLWVSAGIGLIGTHEGVGAKDNQTIINWAKDLGGDIAKEYTHDSIPWCALFMNHILMLAGIKATGSLWALDFAGRWPTVKLIGPAVGAIAPMTRNGGGHVTCIVGKDQNGNPMGLGGNQSDAVNIEPFSISRFNQGFWWPKDVPLPKQIGFSTLPVVRSNGQLSTREA